MFTSAVLSLSTSVRRKIEVTRDWTRQPSSGRTQKPRSGHGVNYQQTGTRQPFYRPEHANLPRVEPRVMVLTIYSPEPFLGLNPETLGHGLNYQQTGTRHFSSGRTSGHGVNYQQTGSIGAVLLFII